MARRVFLSYTSELRDYPAGATSFVRAAEQAVAMADCAAVDMSLFTSHDAPSAAVCRQQLQRCDVYAGLIGFRYGSLVRDHPEISYVEFEFDAAAAAGLARLVFILDEDADKLGIPPNRLHDQESDRGPKQELFRRRLLGDADLMVTMVSDPGQLKLKLYQALVELTGERRSGAGLITGSVSRLPAPRVLFGRDDEVGSLVAAWLATPPEPVAVQGAPGIGKSAVCLAALHDQRIQEHFGPRRWFVRCDGTFSARALLLALADELGVPADGSIDALVYQVRTALLSGPGVLVLDNFETPWHQDAVLVEELLRTVGTISGIAMTITVRGTARPTGLNWRNFPAVRPLSLDDARLFFLNVANVAGADFASDPDLDGLLKALDGMPLAVELLGCAAQGEPDLAGVAQRWREERTGLLRRLGGGRPELSVAASVEASITSPPMTEPARRLFGLLGCLPGGTARGDIDALLPGEGQQAANVLGQLGLIFHEDDRLRMLTPVREHARRAHPPDPAGLSSLVAHYAHLASGVERSGSSAAALARLRAEAANIAAMLQQAADQARIGELVEGMCGLIRYWSVTGTIQQDLLAAAGAVIEAQGTSWQLARILRATGDLARARSQNDEARARYERALKLFQRDEDLCGAANCVMGIGDILRVRSDFDSALACYADALSLYRRAGEVTGEANCLKRQGDVAEDRADYETASARYEQALSLYQDEGEVLGAANCVKSLGDIEKRREHHEAALSRYEEGLRLYRQAGSVLGEANCIKGLGDIAKALSDLRGARTRYGRALRLYQSIAEPGSIGWMHVLIAELEASEAARARHWAAARGAWASIGRPDLIESARRRLQLG